jgi:hypothetical protein
MIFLLIGEGDELRNNHLLMVSPANIEDDQSSLVKFGDDLPIIRCGSPDPVTGKQIQNSLDMGFSLSVPAVSDTKNLFEWSPVYLSNPSDSRCSTFAS